MNSALFNFHDLILAMITFLCILMAAIYVMLQQGKHASTQFLVGFLLAHALIALHELSYYGEQFRYTVLNLSTDLFFIGSFAYCLDVVLLFFFTKALIYRDFKLKRIHLLHLLPFIGYFTYMLFAYYGLSDMHQHQTIKNWTLTTSWHYVTVELLIKIGRIIYGLYCLKLISQYREQQKENRADISSVNLKWLKMLVVGFILVMSVDLILMITKTIGLFTPISISVLSFIGVFTYYLTFFLLLTLLMYTIARLSSIEQISLNKRDEEEGYNAFKPDYIDRIVSFMKTEKPFLDSEITLDLLANRMEVSPKALSVTLNQHFQNNFYEFINGYRIEAAKRILISEPNKSITDIYYDVGFNSKSVFYTFFKKYENMTPSAYRKQIASR